MAICMPFNSIDHDRVYKAEDWAWFFDNFISNGIFPEPGDAMQVRATNSMSVSIQPGAAFIDGYAYKNPAADTKEIAVADGTNPRIDRVVLRWSLGERDMYTAILKGSPSKNPTPPTLTRTADTYELALADVYVGRGVSSITQANITDQRYNSAICGICAGIITQVDASSLTAQFDAYLTEYRGRTEAEFTAWFDTIKGQLSTDAAGNLKNEIDSKLNIANVKNNLTTTEYGYALDARAGKLLNEIKLNKSSVINNLTTDAAGSPLSATQGKVLNDKFAHVNMQSYATDVVINNVTVPEKGDYKLVINGVTNATSYSLPSVRIVDVRVSMSNSEDPNRTYILPYIDNGTIKTWVVTSAVTYDPNTDSLTFSIRNTTTVWTNFNVWVTVLYKRI